MPMRAGHVSVEHPRDPGNMETFSANEISVQVFHPKPKITRVNFNLRGEWLSFEESLYLLNESGQSHKRPQMRMIY